MENENSMPRAQLAKGRKKKYHLHQYYTVSTPNMKESGNVVFPK